MSLLKVYVCKNIALYNVYAFIGLIFKKVVNCCSKGKMMMIKGSKAECHIFYFTQGGSFSLTGAPDCCTFSLNFKRINYVYHLVKETLIFRVCPVRADIISGTYDPARMLGAPPFHCCVMTLSERPSRRSHLTIQIVITTYASYTRPMRWKSLPTQAFIFVPPVNLILRYKHKAWFWWKQCFRTYKIVLSV